MSPRHALYAYERMHMKRGSERVFCTFTKGVTHADHSASESGISESTSVKTHSYTIFLNRIIIAITDALTRQAAT